MNNYEYDLAEAPERVKLEGTLSELDVHIEECILAEILSHHSIQPPHEIEIVELPVMQNITPGAAELEDD